MALIDNLKSLIGKEFAYNGRGPDNFDCYGLIIWIYKLRGIDLPDIRAPDNKMLIAPMMAQESVNWKRVREQRGDSVALFRVGDYLHVAYMLDQETFIHTWEKSGGVMIERLTQQWKSRLIGFYDHE